MATMRNLIPVHPATSIVEARSAGAVVISKSAVPPAVRDGIRNLLLAFTAGHGIAAEDRAQTLWLFAGACNGFEQGIVEYVLQHLVFHNRRNPFPPTPQDVRELCESTSMIWRIRTGRYRLLVTYGCSVADEQGNWPSDIWQADWGPRPGEPDCFASEALVMAGVRQRIKIHEKSLIALPDERFEAIPPEAYPDGFYDYIVANREQREYEASLSLSGRRARLDVLFQMQRSRRDVSEDELRKQTAELLKAPFDGRPVDAIDDVAAKGRV